MDTLAMIVPDEAPALALDIPYEQSFDQWVSLGRQLCSGQKVINWWIGDWWAAGSHRYGERAKAAAEGIFGKEFQTLANLASVARSFEPSRRRELSWSHHAEVASLPAVQADRLLDQAEQGGWSTRDLREQVSRLRDQREFRVPRWMAPSARVEFDRDEVKEAIFGRLQSAADRGEPCPTADDLVELTGVGSVSTTVAFMHVLEEERRIEVQRFQRGRIVTILESGNSTAPPGDLTPHWREQQREAPTPTADAVRRANPDVAAHIFSSARSKGRSPQDYLLDLVWLGWEVECERDSMRRAQNLEAAA